MYNDKFYITVGYFKVIWSPLGDIKHKLNKPMSKIKSINLYKKTPNVREDKAFKETDPHSEVCLIFPIRGSTGTK